MALVTVLAGCDGGGGDAKPAAAASSSPAAPDSAEPTPAGPTRISRADVADLLAGQTRALQAGDETAFLAPYEGSGPEAVGERLRVFANLRLVPFSAAEFIADEAFEDQTAQDTGPLEAEVRVDFRHQVAGVDAVPARTAHLYRFVRSSAEAPLRVAAVAGVAGSGSAAPWDHGEMAVVERPHVVLLAAKADRAKAAGWADTAEGLAASTLAAWKGPALPVTRLLVYAAPSQDLFIQAYEPHPREAKATVTMSCRSVPAADGWSEVCALRSGPGAARIVIRTDSPAFDPQRDEENRWHVGGTFNAAMLAALCQETCNNRSWAQSGYNSSRNWGYTSAKSSFRNAAYAVTHSTAFDGKLPDTDVMWNGSATASDAHRYAASLVVHYIVLEFGSEKAHQFVAAVVRGPDDSVVDAALKAATGLDRGAFEKQWAAWVRASA
ncbi:hypothetical protein OG216_33190 [Streptomycetaceae bacterium NBC_01309]